MKYFYQITLIFIVLVSNSWSQIISLDGEWQFAVDSTNDFKVSTLNSSAEWRAAKVPSSWQAQFDDLRNYLGVAWYKKQIDFTENIRGRRILLHFDAVDYLTTVYINGTEAGSHEGGYTPFEFDITDKIKSGKNEIILRVMDPVETEEGTEGISNFNIPHGKQSWYVQNSGIWQTAFIRIVPENYIRNVRVSPSIDGNVEIQLDINNVAENISKVAINIFDPTDKLVVSEQFTVGNGNKYELTVTDPLHWDTYSPNLYKIEIQYGEDKFNDKFGFRSFEAKDGKLFLNGKIFYMIGALDQDFYPETIYTTPSEEYLRDEMKKAKELGLNTLRCHIKAPDPLYLKVADEIGLIVWYEIPNWDFFSKEAAERGEKTLDEMLARDWNHPSLCVLSIINESWGVDLSKADQRKWMKEAYERAKVKFPGRLVVDNSACWGNFHMKTDINDYHTYWTIPENYKKFDNTIAEISTRPDWLFSKHGDSEETKEEPLMLSEFGNWGLPKLPEKLPWWFSRGFEDIVVSLPEGVYDRFNEFKYDQVFGTYEELAEESQRAQFRALKYEIESIRLSNEIQGYVVTEFTDINWECNGLLDMWRNHKIYSNDLYNIQQEDLIIPRPVEYNYISNDSAEIKLWISHYSNKDLNNYKLNWSSKAGSGTINIPVVETGIVQSLGSVKFLTGEVTVAERLQIDFELVDDNGKITGKNFTEVFLFPGEENISKDVIIYNSSQNNSEQLISGPAVKGKTIITNTCDEYITNSLSEGANVVCVVDSSTKVPDHFPFNIVSRDSAWLDGNWASNMNWLKNERAPLKGITFGKSLGFESVNCRPWRVIQNIPAQYYSDVSAGMYIGWVHLTSAYIVSMKAGKGNLIICTIPVLANRDDPFAAALLNNMVDYISGNEYQTLINWNLSERQ